MKVMPLPFEEFQGKIVLDYTSAATSDSFSLLCGPGGTKRIAMWAALSPLLFLIPEEALALPHLPAQCPPLLAAITPPRVAVAVSAVVQLITWYSHLPEVFTKLGIINAPEWYDAGKEEYFASSSTLFVIEFILFHYVEIRRWQDIKNPGSVNHDPILS